MFFLFYALPVRESIAVRKDIVIRSKNPKTKRTNVFMFFCFFRLFCHTWLRAYLITWQQPGEVRRAGEHVP